jgi:transcriptional regulator with PAS, ATPase and Fis domain
LSLAKLLTRQIIHDDLPVEEAQKLLLASALKKETPGTLAQIKRDAIQSALQRNDGNVRRAAKDLGIGVTSMYRWMRA